MINFSNKEKKIPEEFKEIAKDFKDKSRLDLFAATPPLELGGIESVAISVDD